MLKVLLSKIVSTEPDTTQKGGMIKFERIKRTDERITKLMAIHYSAPKGFVGRNLCYAIYYNDIFYGAIVGGSATLHLPNRHEFFGTTKKDLNNIINNIFYHVEKVDGKYPLRWFTAKVLLEWEKVIIKDWEEKYKDKVIGIESLVELPRTGECYKQSGYSLVGQTHGYTCKRTGGKGTDDWSGKRVWDVENLRPKLVFAKKIK
jgi:hypothetical protein